MSYGVIAYLAIAQGDLVGDVKTNFLLLAALQLVSFIFTSEQHGRLVNEAAFSSYGATCLPRDRWPLLAIWSSP